MKDLQIGKVFMHPTKGMLKVERDPGSCGACVFFSEENPYCRITDSDRYHTGECCSTMRMDRIDVIFTQTAKLKGGSDD